MMARNSFLVSTPILWSIVRVGDRAEDVVPPEPPVEGDGFGELRDVGGGTAGEASAAGNGRFFVHSAP